MLSEEFMKRTLHDIEAHQCGTPFYYELSKAVDSFKAGKPVGDRITVDEVEVKVMNDWRYAGTSMYKDSIREIYVPCLEVEGETSPMKMLDEDDIVGFIPERGHEYLLKVRRIFITKEPFYHHYELLEIIEDKLTK